MSALVNLCWAMLPGMVKHRGGRGRRAPNKHESFSVSLPPHLKALLDSWVTPELSRSEVVAQLVEAHAQAVAPGAEQRGAASGPTFTPQKKLKAPSRSSGERGSRKESQRLQVLSIYIPRGKGWKPEKYELGERLLAQGNILTRKSDKGDWITEKGEVMSWRTAQALLKYGILANLEGAVE